MNKLKPEQKETLKIGKGSYTQIISCFLIENLPFPFYFLLETFRTSECLDPIGQYSSELDVTEIIVIIIICSKTYWRM